MQSLHEAYIPTHRVGKHLDLERKRRSFGNRLIASGVVGGLAVAASVLAIAPNSRDVYSTIADGLPWHQPSRFDISQCTVDAARKLPPDGRYSARFARILGLSIDTIGNHADMYPAACKQAISSEQQREGAEVGGFIVSTGSNTGIEYGQCAIAGVAKQTDKHLPVDEAPMVLACLKPIPFAQV